MCLDIGDRERIAGARGHPAAAATTLLGMSRCRAVVVVLSLALMLPSAAFAQGAGDEQYQDPFGDEQSQQGGGNGGGGEPRAAQDDGLSDAPPGADNGDDGSGDDGQSAPEEPADEPAQQQPEQDSALPNTGSDPRILAFVGLLFVLIGVGLRLRTIDPDAY